MLRVSFRNLLVRDAFKVVPLELAMSSFLVCLFCVVLLECATYQQIPKAYTKHNNLTSMTVWKSKHKIENISASNTAMKLKLGEHVIA